MELSTYGQLRITAKPALTTSDSSAIVVPSDSAAIRRLMDEVRDEQLTEVSAAAHYNRQHNRHNR